MSHRPDHRSPPDHRQRRQAKAPPTWPPDGLHAGRPCSAWRPGDPPGHTRAADDPMPSTLWRGHVRPTARGGYQPTLDVRRDPPRNWLDRPKRGWQPFKAQVCPDCGTWRPYPTGKPPALQPRLPALPPPPLIGPPYASPITAKPSAGCCGGCQGHAGRR